MVCLLSVGQHQRNRLGWEWALGDGGNEAKIEESLVAKRQIETVVLQ